MGTGRYYMISICTEAPVVQQSCYTVKKAQSMSSADSGWRRANFRKSENSDQCLICVPRHRGLDRNLTDSDMAFYCAYGRLRYLSRRRPIVSLPQEWFQEIKRMMVMHSTHGLFLTCTQISFIFTQCTVNQYLHNVQTIVNQTPCRNNEDPQLTWTTNVLLMVANSHPLWSLAC
jgi:hypothetical protein